MDDEGEPWTATTAPYQLSFRVIDIIVLYLGAFISAAWNDRDVTGILVPAVRRYVFVYDQAFVNLGYRYEWFGDVREESITMPITAIMCSISGPVYGVVPGPSTRRP